MITVIHTFFQEVSQVFLRKMLKFLVYLHDVCLSHDVTQCLQWIHVTIHRNVQLFSWHLLARCPCKCPFLITSSFNTLSEKSAFKVQELNSVTEASFSFFISNIFRSVKSKNIAFRMFFCSIL